MNTFAKLMIAGTLALSATTVSAAGANIAGDYINASKTFSTAAALSQEAAYQLGLDTLNQVAGKPAWSLAQALPGGIVDSSAQVTGQGHVRVIERLNAAGAREFVAMVSVPVSYKVVDTDR